MLALGVLPGHRQRRLATRLLAAAADAALALPSGDIRRVQQEEESNTKVRVHAVVSEDDTSARAFWKARGCVEQVETRPWRAASRGGVVVVDGLVEF